MDVLRAGQVCVGKLTCGDLPQDYTEAAARQKRKYPHIIFIFFMESLKWMRNLFQKQKDKRIPAHTRTKKLFEAKETRKRKTTVDDRSRDSELMSFHRICRRKSSVYNHLVANPDCCNSYSDSSFTVLCRGRHGYGLQLKVLEAIHYLAQR